MSVDQSLRVICVLPLCLRVSLSLRRLTNVSAGVLWVTKCYLKDNLRMFPLPQSDHRNVASQKSLGEDSGDHRMPGFEVAAMATAVAPDNRRTLSSRWISSQTGLGKPMGPGYRGESVSASLRSSQCRVAIRRMGLRGLWGMAKPCPWNVCELMSRQVQMHSGTH